MGALVAGTEMLPVNEPSALAVTVPITVAPVSPCGEFAVKTICAFAIGRSIALPDNDAAATTPEEVDALVPEELPPPPHAAIVNDIAASGTHIRRHTVLRSARFVAKRLRKPARCFVIVIEPPS